MSKTLDRISKVLNQAENAGTPEEAAVFMAKAQELSTLAQIDLAVARAHTVNKEKREEVTEGRIKCNPHNRRFNRKYFMDLAAVIAEANDCKVLYGGGESFIFPTGFPSDIEVTEALFGILSVQMVSDCDVALKNGANKTVQRVPKRVRVEIPDEERAWGEWIGENKNGASRGHYADDAYETWKPQPPKFKNEKVRDDDGHVVYEEKSVTQMDGRLYRQNFYAGFIARTRSRLWEAKRKAQATSGADIEDSSTALAMRDKTKEVDDAFSERLKKLNARGVYSSAEPTAVDINAWQHGGDAAARARLDSDASVGASNRKEIG